LLKLTESLTFAGDLESMVASTALRGAVTSAELTFSPVVTALTSCMYLAAAVSGFLCSQRPRPRCFAHFVPAVLDSLAIAGRGSFLIVCLITILGFGLAWRGDMRKAAQKLGGAAVGVCIVVFGLSLGVGRGDVLENGWEYVVAPIFGLDEYLRLRPPPGIDGMTLVNALSAKLGGQTYDAGDFVWYAAFKGNVSSGFKEVASDFGMAGLMLFPLLGAAAAHFHQRFRQLEEWSSYALALSCCSLLGYFYYVSLSSFLPAWWALVGTGVASAGLELLGRIVRMQRPAPPAG
jgi:oligosaccharide repeat unit polymerase